MTRCSFGAFEEAGSQKPPSSTRCEGASREHYAQWLPPATEHLVDAEQMLLEAGRGHEGTRSARRLCQLARRPRRAAPVVYEDSVTASATTQPRLVHLRGSHDGRPARAEDPRTRRKNSNATRSGRACVRGKRRSSGGQSVIELADGVVPVISQRRPRGHRTRGR